MITRMTDRACLLMLCSWLVSGGCGDNGSVERPAPDDPTIVQLDNGGVQGTLVGDTRQYLGIPYAKPPVGPLRWKAPQPPDAWTDLRQATAFGKRCAQTANAVLQNAASADEDCLYLNVWTPFPEPVRPVPVMLWIHGGGNVNGSASEPVPYIKTGVFYSGQSLAEKHGVVVVSINYRLGVFGFFGHSALEAEGSVGNQGLLDQQLAMQWVRDNIGKFGGDASKVTIFGESAGSIDVCMHVASPRSRGLFHRAISESGGCTTVQTTKDEADASAKALATTLGCTGADALACLRGKSVADLLTAGASGNFDPEVDGQFLPDQPRTLYDSGQVAKVPYLLGSNTDEGTLFLIGSRVQTEDDYKVALAMTFGAPTATAVALRYPVANFANAPPNPALAALARVVGDSRLVCGTYDTAVRASENAPVFMYNYDIPVPAAALPPGVYLGASHGSELTSVFGTSPLLQSDAQARAASDLMQRYWTNFAKTGDPNGGDDPKWPELTADDNVRMNFAIPQSEVKADFRKDECAFWRAGYDLQFP
jgi:para-nitrobenzyl esterase